jgi:Holliday junction DNA helicase RuvA
MYAYIRGKLTIKTPTYVVLENHGVGYHINISLNTYSQIESKEETALITYLHVKEDSLTLFGFSNAEERDLFLKLISVSGIGPSTAQIVLSSLTVSEVQSAIYQERPEAFKKVKGVGPKTAQRIILDLKDKVKVTAGQELLTSSNRGNRMYGEALSALVRLGFPRTRVEQVLSKIHKTGAEIKQVEDLVKIALQELS